MTESVRFGIDAYLVIINMQKLWLSCLTKVESCLNEPCQGEALLRSPETIKKFYGHEKNFLSKSNVIKLFVGN